jgi:hypothetical protein
VPWIAVQSLLAESRNDALILLDCCASGTANSSEGNGVTELISACAWNETANSVGPYSLTASLTIELEFLSEKFQFSIGELYKNIYTRTQLRMPETMAGNGKAFERHPAPIHLVLTQVHPNPRSIHISKLRCPGGDQSVCLHSGPSMRDQGHMVSEEKSQRYTIGLQPLVDGHGPSNQAQCFQFSSSVVSNQDSPKTVWSSSRQWEGSPRLAFSVRLRETINPEEHMTKLFTEWLKDFPVVAEEVSVEAGFGSFSTLLIVSLPMAPWLLFLHNFPRIQPSDVLGQSLHRIRCQSL